MRRRPVGQGSTLVDLTGLLVVLSYQTQQGYPPATYMEYPVLVALDAAILLLILHRKGTALWRAPLYAAAYVCEWWLLEAYRYSRPVNGRSNGHSALTCTR